DESLARSLVLDLVSKDPLVRSSAALALGKLQWLECATTLIEFLRADHHWVRYAAAVALGEMLEKRSVDPLCELMINDEDFLVRAGAARSLGKIGDRRAIKALRRGAVKDRNELVRADCLESLRIIWGGSDDESGPASGGVN
ncbi:MAG TPA: HEAT repeat domain-containing protein, partial [Acidobacteriota bacterium]|nr:HEAT repeat domain-containing protein [Acidobacteriota bacterium]